MKIKFLFVAFYIAFSAHAQATYTEGTITYTTNVRGSEIQDQEYFSPDSVATQLIAGPAIIRQIADAQYKFFAVLLDVSAFNIKKAAIYSSEEISQALNSYPVLTFAPASEARQISGFNCTKVVATDPATQQTYEVWITNDISAPAHAMPPYYKAVGGFPVQYTSFTKGPDGNLAVLEVTVTSVTNQRAPAGTFSIPPDFDRITKADLEAMSPGQ